MPQSLAQIYLHIIFSTKNRAPFLHTASSRLRMHRYLSGICNSSGSPAIEGLGHVLSLWHAFSVRDMSDAEHLGRRSFGCASLALP